MSLNRQIYGLVGYPVKHSLSPSMHNAAFEYLGLNAEYRLFEVKPDDLEDFLINRRDVLGFNVTVPYKVKAKEILGKELSIARDLSEAEIAVSITSAINTVKREPELKLYNTDVLGFSRSLIEDLGFDKKDKKALVIGSGGAGRAVIAGLSEENNSASKIYIFEIDRDTAYSVSRHLFGIERLKGKFEFIEGLEIPSIIKECDLVVNATAVGMRDGDGVAIDLNLLHKGLSVYDVVYNRETALVKEARSLCISVSDGLGMLLYQGAAAFEIFTGEDAPVNIMREALLKGAKR
ncbi:MAG: shikimate dehydrogenase [Candidatus Kaelpia imicola]|nr:shikimate dehydrogenase [Candidatus Kaelpia imicola]